MTVLGWGACDSWVTPQEIVDLACIDAGLIAGANAAAAATAAEWATDILWRMSGQVEGTCTYTTWVDLPGCAQAECDGCCGDLHRIELGGDTPVAEVTTVKVVTREDDGTIVTETLADDAYRVDDHLWLVRIDGEPWPHRRCIGEDPTGVEVTASYGTTVSLAAKKAAAAFAAEEIKRCTSGDCAFPKRLRMVTIQGVGYPVIDPMEFLKERKTGIYITDVWLGVADHTMDGRIFDPSVGRQHVLVGT